MKPKTDDDQPKVEEKKGQNPPPEKIADLDRRKSRWFAQKGHEVVK